MINFVEWDTKIGNYEAKNWRKINKKNIDLTLTVFSNFFKCKAVFGSISSSVLSAVPSEILGNTSFVLLLARIFYGTSMISS